MQPCPTKHPETVVESVIEEPELIMKSLHFTPNPMLTGAFSWLMMVPFSRHVAPSRMA